MVFGLLMFPATLVAPERRKGSVGTPPERRLRGRDAARANAARSALTGNPGDNALNPGFGGRSPKRVKPPFQPLGLLPSEAGGQSGPTTRVLKRFKTPLQSRTGIVQFFAALRSARYSSFMAAF